jgi:predicted protein tyrosine phosphatase
MMIHVCSLARLADTVERTGARHVVTLLGDEDPILRPDGIAAADHLWLRMHDIAEPADGFIAPCTDHVRQLIDFVHRWDRRTPVVMHCWAGISRSTAAAFVSVCALAPERDEIAVAQALRLASATACPNVRIVALADEMLGRRGRMIEAVAAIGCGAEAAEGIPFRLDLA